MKYFIFMAVLTTGAFARADISVSRDGDQFTVTEFNPVPNQTCPFVQPARRVQIKRAASRLKWMGHRRAMMLGFTAVPPLPPFPVNPTLYDYVTFYDVAAKLQDLLASKVEDVVIPEVTPGYADVRKVIRASIGSHAGS